MGIARQGGRLAPSSRRLFGSDMSGTCDFQHTPLARVVQQSPSCVWFEWGSWWSTGHDDNGADKFRWLWVLNSSPIRGTLYRWEELWSRWNLCRNSGNFTKR